MSELPDSLVVVRGGGLVLRDYREADFDRLRVAFADPDVKAWNPGADDADGVREWMRRRNDWSNGGHASWAVADSDDLLVGSLSLHQMDLDQRSSEIGYWVSPDARGRGIATASVRLAVGWAFDEVTLHRVYLYHSLDNPSSCRVASAAGFRMEGHLRRSHRYADGKYHDEHLHAVLADEWPAPQAPGG